MREDPRTTAGNWHGGQTSPLYSFASTGERHFALLFYKLEIKALLNYPACPDKEKRKLKRLYRHLKTLPKFLG